MKSAIRQDWINNNDEKEKSPQLLHINSNEDTVRFITTPYHAEQETSIFTSTPVNYTITLPIMVQSILISLCNN